MSCSKGACGCLLFQRAARRWCFGIATKEICSVSRSFSGLTNDARLYRREKRLGCSYWSGTGSGKTFGSTLMLPPFCWVTWRSDSVVPEVLFLRLLLLLLRADWLIFWSYWRKTLRRRARGGECSSEIIANRSWQTWWGRRARAFRRPWPRCGARASLVSTGNTSQ